jgi:hypothetical protein
MWAMNNFFPSVIAAAEGAATPAGGAAIGEVIGATSGALIVTAALLWLASAHRSGRSDILRNAAAWAERRTGMPGWAALPSLLVTVALITALFGMYWDISLHIDNGRDPGPLANPAHYFILVGLFGIFAAGLIAISLPEERPSRVAVKIAPNWYASLGGIVLLVTASFSLAGFPLDDMWHRLFGQDVTLWGPTHLMLIGGAGLTLVGHAILMVEGGDPAATGGKVPGGFIGMVAKTRLAGVCGGLLIGLSTFQGEFDFGVPQFRLVFQPVLICVAAGVALVAARTYTGRGGALMAVVYFLVIRGIVSLLVGPVLGETLPHMPLYIVEALAVEAVALFLKPDRPYRFGAVAGLGVGTIGFAAEWGWSHIWMPDSWPAAMLGEALPLVPLVGVAAGVIGAFVGTALAAPRTRGGLVAPSVVPAAIGVIVIAAVVGYGLHVSPQKGVSAQLTTSQPRGPDRMVDVTARITPASAAENPNWLHVIAWQGKQKLVLRKLTNLGGGVYRTTAPVPAGGSWKTMLQLHRDNSLLSAGVYLPGDSAIPAKEIPLRPKATRPFIYDHELLQRERKKDVPSVLPAIAYGTVGSIVIVFVLMLGWALARLARGFAPEPATTRS